MSTHAPSRGRHAAFTPSLPSLLAEDVRTGLVEYLSTTYSLADPAARNVLAAFLDSSEHGIFRGPYLRLRPPFRSVTPTWASPLSWMPAGFTPYLHQARAFERLSSRDHAPRPTLVTTGTGSGKTEAFLLPLLDHARRAHGRGLSGITAIILYPMNALATDQARRIARTVSSAPELDGVRVGLYIGGDGHHRVMSAEHVIDHRDTLRTHPPHILLTNYKMLDLLLMDPRHADLWRGAGQDLQYLVLDEFHTYDGAQGTDVAMLLRRLGAALGIARPGRPLGDVVPVATSATLGDLTSSRSPDGRPDPGGANAATAPMRDLARTVFGRPFEADCVITEDRFTLDEAFPGPGENATRIFPDPGDIAAVSAPTDAAGWRRLAQSVLVTGDGRPATDDLSDPVALGQRLTGHAVGQTLLRVLGTRPVTVDEALMALGRATMRPWYSTDPATRRVGVSALSRLLALASYARTQDPATGRLRPLIDVQVQLWVRDVHRLLREVSAEPSFTWWTPTTVKEEGATFLPAVYCRSCGASGWAALRPGTAERHTEGALNAHHLAIWQAGVSSTDHSRLRYLMRAADPKGAHLLDPSGPALLRPAPEESEAHQRFIPVHQPLTGDDARRDTCPACGTRDAVRFMGTAASTLLSVALSQAFGSTHLPDEEKKTLVFTDSVQDAAHRAAFIEARAFRFNLRSALYRAARAAGGRTTLEDLSHNLVPATTPRHEGDQELYLLAPPSLVRRMGWDRDNAWLAADRGGARHKAVRQRLAQEAHLEAGLFARLGRTLELTGSWNVDVDLTGEDLSDVADILRESHLNSAGYVPGTQAPRRAYEQWLLGLLDHLRLAGGIAHPWLEPYRDQDGRTWLVGGGARHRAMHRFGPRSARPGFLTTGRTDKDSDFITLNGAPTTWAGDWTRRCLGVSDAPTDGSAGALLREAAELLASRGVLDPRSTPTGRTYGLDPQRLVIDTREAARLVCDRCRQVLTVAPEREAAWTGARCTRWHCTGTLGPAPGQAASEGGVGQGADYYRALYTQGRLRPIKAREHTALLDRQRREELEEAFARSDTGTDPNVLTCTPTLELGVDIGDLSVVCLASLPRTTASYLQRVGRAGRSDGNALVLAVVRPTTRTMPYLEEPAELLDGVVRPPAAYLRATELLTRQLTAHVLDTAVPDSVPAPPGSIRTVFEQWRDARRPAPSGTGGEAADPAPCWLDTFTGYVSAHAETLVDSFLALFPGEVAPARDHLIAHCRVGLPAAVDRIASRWDAETRALREQSEQTRASIDRLLALGHRDEADERDLERLRGEARALRGRQTRHLNDPEINETFTALGREGLLPGYNLLDDSTTLEAHLWWRGDSQDSATSDIQNVDYEVTRPSATALSELAPGASFYAYGRKVVVDAIDLNADEATAGLTCVCPACGWSGPSPRAEGCPQCHSLGVTDVGQRVTMRPLRRVSSVASIEDTTITDSMEERSRLAFDMAWGVDPQDSVTSAWRLSDYTFGVEHLSRAVVRSYNLGPLSRSGPGLVVGGTEHQAPGFLTCTMCGVVDLREGSNAGQAVRHRGFCRTRRGEKEKWTRVYLKHELTTQALRVLLPETALDDPAELVALEAALMLGIRLDLGGDPQHLDIRDVPGRSKGVPTRYLVVADTVPGGTGYLDRYADPEVLRDVLGRALTHLRSCRCAGSRDGCHHCVLGVLPTIHLELASRRRSIEVLENLLETWATEKIDSLDDITVQAQPESVLEARFRRYLATWAEAHGGRVTPVDTGDGYTSMRLTVPSADGTDLIGWVVRAQRRVRGTVTDYTLSREDHRGATVNVYLDGRAFHAGQGGLNRLGADARLRHGLRQSGELVISLTWDDVEEAQRELDNPARAVSASWMSSTVRTDVAARLEDPRTTALWSNPLDLLTAILQDPDSDLWQKAAVAVAVALAGSHQDPSLPPCYVPADALPAAIDSLGAGTPVPTTGPQDVLLLPCRTATGLPIILSVQDPTCPEHSVSAYLRLPDADTDVVRPGFAELWHDWLRWGNVLQMLGISPAHGSTPPREACAFTASTPTILEAPPESATVAPAHGTRAEEPETPPPPGPGGTEDAGQAAAWEEVLDLVSSKLRLCTEALRHRGARLPLVGEEVGDDRVSWPIELLWDDEHLAVVVDAAPERDDYLQARGFTVLNALDAADRATDLIMAHLAGEK